MAQRPQVPAQSAAIRGEPPRGIEPGPAGVLGRSGSQGDAPQRAVAPDGEHLSWDEVRITQPGVVSLTENPHVRYRRQGTKEER
jgi:hypothetical protein